LPNALNCGCSYELFWHLNPKKLEPFYEANRLRTKEQTTMQDSFAWLQGFYVREAFLSCINRSVSYPKSPIGLNRDNFYSQGEDAESSSPHRMSDGQNFALFMVKHNKTIKEKRAKQNNNA
jgi:hypothetical protein